jgi:hypothetical protein
MNRKLKFFLVSFVCALIISTIIFIIIPITFAGIGGGPFGSGLLLIMGILRLYILTLPFIIGALMIVFILITLNYAQKGERLILTFIVALAFILAFGIIIGGLITKSKYEDYAKEKKRNEALQITLLAIENNDVSNCYKIRDLSTYSWMTCFFWTAYKNQDYSYCERLPKSLYQSINQRDCLLMAVVKTKDISYCKNFKNQTQKQECLVIFSRISNETFIKNYNPEEFNSKTFGYSCERMSINPKNCDYDFNYYISAYDYNPKTYLKE